MNVLLPNNENARLSALRDCRILDTAPEVAFDRIVSLAAATLEMPMASISFVDHDRLWRKAAKGFPVGDSSREYSFCAHAIIGGDLFVVPDAADDPRFAQNPMVTGESGVRFYAGVVLRAPAGEPLGTLCVFDRQPREFDERQRAILRDLAAFVLDELALRTQCQRLNESHATIERQDENRTEELSRANRDLLASESRFRQFFNQASDAAFVHDVDGRVVDVNEAACASLGYSRDEMLRMGVPDFEMTHTPEGFQFWREITVGSVEQLEGRHRRKDGTSFPVDVRVSVLDTAQGRRLLAVVRDITARKRHEEALRVRALQQEAVATLGSTALSGGSVDELLLLAVSLIGRTLGVEFCRVFEYLPAQKAFVGRAGLHDSNRNEGRIVSGDEIGYGEYVFRTGQPVVTQDTDSETRFAVPELARTLGITCGLSVLIGGPNPGDLRFGVLALATREKRVLTDDDVFFAQSMANTLAAAIVRRRKDDELRAMEASLQRISTNTPGVVYQYLVQPNGVQSIPFISESCRALYGREAREIQRNPQLMLDAIHPDDMLGFVQAALEAEKTLTPLIWEGRHRLPNGEIRWVRLHSRPERLTFDSFIYDGIIVDITAEVLSKKALAQSEERFRLANMHSPFPVMLHTDDGEILQVNHAWTQMTGYRAGELSRVDDWIALAYPEQEDRDELRRCLGDLISRGGSLESRGQQIRCASGEMRVWDISHANLDRLADGRWLHISTAVDVTERLQGEAALRAARDEAERANLAKSMFLSRMSHELRTPLNAILGFGQLLELSTLEEMDSTSVKYILKGGRHLLSLIDEVLDLSRAETGDLHLMYSEFSVDELVRECLGLVARLAQGRGITCRMKTSGHRITLRSDEQRLRQMLLNLISNAIKYNREGGQVAVSCELVAGGRVKLQVSDTGHGISSEVIDRLFVPFERLEQAYGEVEGTGLGLAVSRRLAEALNGSVGVESEVGKGSVFWIELPGVVADEEFAGQAGNAGSAAANPNELPRAATLLYIEDNQSNLQVVRSLLARSRPHWRFLSATEGRQGLDDARRNLPDLILLDLQLPGLPGDRVLAELRLDQSTRHIPVIVLSADATAHSRERLLTSGANYYLTKPFQLDTLLELADRMLSKPAADPQWN